MRGTSRWHDVNISTLLPYWPTALLPLIMKRNTGAGWEEEKETRQFPVCVYVIAEGIRWTEKLKPLAKKVRHGLFGPSLFL